MKNLDLNNYGVQEMNAVEMREVNGGKKVEYTEYKWSGTDNPIIYAAEAVYNGGVSLINAGKWIYNQFQ